MAVFFDIRALFGVQAFRVVGVFFGVPNFDGVFLGDKIFLRVGVPIMVGVFWGLAVFVVYDMPFGERDATFDDSRATVRRCTVPGVSFGVPTFLGVATCFGVVDFLGDGKAGTRAFLGASVTGDIGFLG